MATAAKIILVCRMDGIEMLNAETLNTIKAIAVGVDEKTYDISFDEVHNIILVLSGRSGSVYPLSYSGSLWLSSYSFPEGIQQQTVQFASLGLTDHADLAVDSSRNRIAISVTRRQRTPWSSDIFVCNENPIKDCTHELKTRPVSQMIFLGNKLLFVNDSQDGAGDCVEGVDLQTHFASHEYCEPRSGVRFAFGVVAQRFVVAFTGSLKRQGMMSDNYLNKDNSFAIWNVENPHAAGAGSFLLNTDVVQRTMHVVASSTKSIFLAYADVGQKHPAELDLYTVQMLDGK